MKIKYILKIYDALVNDGNVVRKDFCKQYAITERTFYRYMSEITDFLKLYKSDYIISVIDYEGRYYLKKLN